MILRRATLVIAVVLIGGAFVAAQEPDRPNWLDDVAGKELVQRLVAMGVEPDAAEAVAIPSEPELQWISLHTEPDQRLAVLFIPCSGDSAFAYLVRRFGNEWRATDHVGFDCHYDGTVSLEVAATARKSVEDVFVHHACVSHGTGFVQQNFRVFTVRDSKLRSVLDTEEVVVAANDGFDKYQRSSFVIVPLPEGRVIEETRSTTLNGKLTVERRYFRWIASKSSYRPSRFTPVSSSSP